MLKNRDRVWFGASMPHLRIGCTKEKQKQKWLEARMQWFHGWVRTQLKKAATAISVHGSDVSAYLPSGCCGEPAAYTFLCNSINKDGGNYDGLIISKALRVENSRCRTPCANCEHTFGDVVSYESM